jgi:hypothetical protein
MNAVIHVNDDNHDDDTVISNDGDDIDTASDRRVTATFIYIIQKVLLALVWVQIHLL